MIKKILLRALLYTLLAFLIFCGISYFSAKDYPDNPPMGGATLRYQERFSLAGTWPFFYKYYLYVPEGYSSDRQYPLVVLLHGLSRHMRGGEYIISPAVQEKYQSFVLVPIAPQGMTWGGKMVPGAEDATSLAYNAVRKVEKRYPIDTDRIYLSGYSMGGVGTFAMIEKYPTKFAAALPLCGGWVPDRAQFFPEDVPILAAHGSEDNPATSISMVDALIGQGVSASYREYRGVRHNVWDYAYRDMYVWDWLFSQKR